MSASLKTLAHEMESAIGSIALKVEALQDVEIAMGQLRESMDGAVYRGEEMVYYRQHHREVRMLSELLRYLVIDLATVFENAEKIQMAIFNHVGKGGQANEQNGTEV